MILHRKLGLIQPKHEPSSEEARKLFVSPGVVSNYLFGQHPGTTSGVNLRSREVANSQSPNVVFSCKRIRPLFMILKSCVFPITRL